MNQEVEPTDPEQPVYLRIAVLIAFALMGVVVGVTGSFLQAQRFIVTFGENVVVLPWGMMTVLAGVIALTRLATVATQTRWGAWLFFTGWLATTILLAAESPSGDLAISSGGRQLVYLFGGVILSVAIATFPVNFRSRKRDQDVNGEREPQSVTLRPFQ